MLGKCILSGRVCVCWGCRGKEEAGFGRRGRELGLRGPGALTLQRRDAMGWQCWWDAGQQGIMSHSCGSTGNLGWVGKMLGARLTSLL